MPPYRWDETPPPVSWEITEDAGLHWQRRLEVAREADNPAFRLSPDAILLGSNLATGRPMGILPEVLSTHMHVVGATGVGKSFFIEGIIKNLIVQGHGVCVIDPHGSLYDHLLDFCAYADSVAPELSLAKRVIPFDVAENRHILGFNPVQRNARIKVYQVVALMEAIRKCWGQGSFQETPRLARWLFNTIYAVIEAELTFLQTYHLVTPQNTPLRQAIIKRISNPNVRAEWEYLTRIKSDEKREERVESCLNRIRPFVEHDLIRNILGQYTNTIDFHNVIAEQKILLVNLAGQNVIAADDRHLLGTMLVNELLTAAFARKPGNLNPYYLVIDEFQHFVTKDICEILDGGRKFGLHLILAHQHLNQLRQKDPEVYFSTLTNARTKVVFGGLIDEDLETLSKELYTGELDLNAVKDEIWQTKFRPVESSRVIVSDTESSGESWGEVAHESLVQSETFIPGSNGWSEDADPASKMAGTAAGSSITTGGSFARGRSVTEVPWYEQHEFRELSSRTFISLEEQLYLKKAQMKRQPRQHAAILIPGENVALVKTPTLEEVEISTSLRNEFKLACFEGAGCFKERTAAEREVRALEESLLLGGRPASPEITIEVPKQPVHEDEEFLG